MIAKYSGSLTGEPIMLHETRTVARMLLKGLTQQEIKEQIMEDNDFGYKTKKSIPKRLSSIFRRLKRFDEELLKIIVDDLSGDGKILIVYAIALENRLFSELISENIFSKFSTREYEYPKTIILKFINEKGELNEQIGSFKEYTKYRLSISMFNILKEAGIIIIKEKVPYLQSINVSYTLGNLFEKRKDLRFLKNLGASVWKLKKELICWKRNYKNLDS